MPSISNLILAMSSMQIGILVSVLLLVAVACYIVLRLMKTAFSDLYMISGNKLVKAQKYEQAKQKNLKAIKANKFKKGTAAAAYNNVVFCEYIQKKYDSALDFANQCLAKCGDDAVTLAMCGKIYFDMENYEKAVEFWNRKLSKNEDAVSYGNVALSYAKLGDYKSANKSINDAQRLKFEDIKTLRKEVKKALVEFGVKDKLSDFVEEEEAQEARDEKQINEEVKED